MDVLLTHGFYLYEDPQERSVMRPYPTLGLLYLSAYLKRHGVDVDVFDATFSSREAFETHVRKRRPPIVGIYCNLITRSAALDLIRISRKYGAYVVVGGPEAANYPGNYLAHRADVVVIGEGEQTMRELIPRLLRSGPCDLRDVKGIVYREDEELVRTPARGFIDDLDLLPFPDRESIDIAQYMAVWRQHHGRSSISLMTSRGCPYSCAWCSRPIFGTSHRRRSPENVADEVEMIIDRYDPDMLWYADDVFTIKPSWFYAYAEELRKRSIRIPFETISREDRLNEDVVRTLAEMGCFRLWVGSESGSQEVLDRMKRRTDAARVPDVIHLLQRFGIEAGMFIMFGYEGETEKHIHETVDRVKEASPDVLLTTVSYPVKGTPYYEEVEDRIVPLKPWSESSDRDLSIAGRRSRKFYVHANRWMLNEYAFYRERQRRSPNLRALTRHFLASKAGRMGMLMSRHQREAPYA